jgi:hypothetical protein
MLINNPKGVKPKMKERELRSGVIWQGGGKAKRRKTKGCETRAGCTTNIFLYSNKDEIRKTLPDSRDKSYNVASNAAS